MTLELVALDCPTCGSSVEAEGGDVVYYCISCRNGYFFDRQDRALRPVDVAFVALSHVSAERYLPFWHLPATIEIHQRDAQAGSFRGLIKSFASLFTDDSGPSRAAGSFVVPAFDASLAAVTELVRRYTLAFPSLGEKLGERLVGGCYGVEDARKLAHFALIATEVERPDLLKKLDYSIEFGAARLLGVPFVEQGGGWRDALNEIRI